MLTKIVNKKMMHWFHGPQTANPYTTHVFDELTSNIKDLIIWINFSLFLKIACNKTSISSNNSK